MIDLQRPIPLIGHRPAPTPASLSNGMLTVRTPRLVFGGPNRHPVPVYLNALLIRTPPVSRLMSPTLAIMATGAVHTAPPAAMVGALIPVFMVSMFATVSALVSYNSEADRIRERIEEEAAPRTPIIINVGEGATVESLTGLVPDPGAARISDSMEKQEAILREMHTQGLAQARNSFRVSLAFVVIGSLVLLGGVVLAILNAPGTGDRYAGIVATSAGVVINVTSSVFFVQSNRARRSMGEQGAMLREESRDDRRLNAARELIAAISATGLRNDIRARLALQLLSAPPTDSPPPLRLPPRRQPHPLSPRTCRSTDEVDRFGHIPVRLDAVFSRKRSAPPKSRMS